MRLLEKNVCDGCTLTRELTTSTRDDQVKLTDRSAPRHAAAHSQTYPPRSSKQLDGTSAGKEAGPLSATSLSNVVIPDDGSGGLDEEEEMESFRWNSVSNWGDGCIYGVDDARPCDTYATPTDSASTSPQDRAQGAVSVSQVQQQTQDQPRISPTLQTTTTDKRNTQSVSSHRTCTRQSSSPARPFDEIYNEEEILMMDALMTGTNTNTVVDKTEQAPPKDHKCKQSQSNHSQQTRKEDTDCPSMNTSGEVNETDEARQGPEGQFADIVIQPSTSTEERVSGFSKMLGLFSRIRSNSRSNSKYRVHTVT